MGTKRGSNGEGKVAGAPGQAEPEQVIDEPMNAGERMARELARVRANFGMDPSDPREPLDEAWMSPTAPMEEDEAEFVDAVADCLGAGLPLEAALSCWHNDQLACEEDGDDDDTAPVMVMAAHHPPNGGRRLVVR
jgi:hypothetical protein